MKKGNQTDMWIQVKNNEGNWENRIAAEGTMATMHLERLQKLYGMANVRPSPSTVKAGIVCACKETAGDGLLLCAAHAVEFRRRAEALRVSIADEVKNYIKSQAVNMVPPVKVALEYWAERIRKGGR